MNQFQTGLRFDLARRTLRALSVVALLMLVFGLSACGSIAYREGNKLLAEGKYEEGMAKLEEAVQRDPRNAEYRLRLKTERERQIRQLVATADTARRDGKLGEAEKAYRQVLAIDAYNERARQGLEALITERRHRQAVQEAEALFRKGKDADLLQAAGILRTVLTENPNQPQALNLKARIDEAQAKKPRPEVKLAAAYRKPITLEFRDAPIKSVFDVISKVSGLNFFLDKDVRPDLKVTVLAKDTSIEDAIRLLLATNQLEQKVLNENSVLIYPNTPQKLKDYQSVMVRTFYLANADVKAVSTTIKTILKTQDLVVDERLGLIIMRDTPEVIELAERIIALQDLTDPEVVLDVEVIEIKRSRLLELGVRWPEQATLTPLPGTAGGPLTLEDIYEIDRSTTQVGIGSVVANARTERTTGDILANPRIRVRNKDKAQILIGDRVPIITTTSTSTGFVSESVSYVDVGLKLEVEPNIYLDDEVAIKINLEVSNIVREVISQSGTLTFQIGTRNASTVLRLKDGENQILAGLISEEDRSTANHIPGLGELPVLERLFGSRKDEKLRSEIILSITPRLVRTIRRPDMLAAEFESGTQTTIGAKKLQLATVDTDSKSDASAPTGKPAAAPAETEASGDGAPVAGLRFSWDAPAEVRAGEQFTATLNISSNDAISGLPLVLNFDTGSLEVVSVQEGDFFKQFGGQPSFSHRVEPTDGFIFVSSVRKTPMGGEQGVNGTGSLVLVTFKAVKPNADARFGLLSASPEPEPPEPVTASVDQVIKIKP